MNSSIIRFILGHVLRIEGLLLFLPAIVSGIYQEHEGLYYVTVAAICLLLGAFMTWKPPKSISMYCHCFKLDYTQLFWMPSFLFKRGNPILNRRFI